MPVNEFEAPNRSAALARNVSQTVSLARELNPKGVVLVKQNVFDLLRRPMVEAGLPLLHDQFIPFPGSGQQKRFRERFERAVALLGSGPTMLGPRRGRARDDDNP